MRLYLCSYCFRCPRGRRRYTFAPLLHRHTSCRSGADIAARDRGGLTLMLCSSFHVRLAAVISAPRGSKSRRLRVNSRAYTVWLGVRIRGHGGSANDSPEQNSARVSYLLPPYNAAQAALTHHNIHQHRGQRGETQSHIHTHTHTHSARACACACTCVHDLRFRACVYIFLCVCVCLCVSVYYCVCVLLCVCYCARVYACAVVCSMLHVLCV